MEALNNFRFVFGNFDSFWSHPSYEVTRKPEQPEFFSFVQSEILFLGVHIVGGDRFTVNSNEKEGWRDHIRRSIDWVRNETTHRNGTFEFIVIFGNSRQTFDNDLFFDELRDLSKELEQHLLYVFDGANESLMRRQDYYWTLEIEGDKIPFANVRVHAFNCSDSCYK